MRTKKESVSKTLCNTEDTWKQWKRFEGGLDEGNYLVIKISNYLYTIIS